VSAAYRLNILGFLCTLDSVSPGNYGMLDQVAVLDWVKEKIPTFGGSTNNITLFGHGSGGVSVGLHLVSPLSAGKFHKAIAMSGNALVPWAVKKPEAEEMKLALIAEKFNCPKSPSLKLVECLRKIDALTLAKSSSSVDIGTWGPVIDGDYANASYIFLPQDPLDLMKDGQTKNMVPLMVGYTDMEEALMFSNTNLEKGIDRGQFESLMLDQISTELNDANMSCTNEQYILDAVLFYYSPQPQTTDTMMLRQKLMDFATEKKYGAGAFLQAIYNSKHSPTFLYRFDYKIRTTISDSPLPDWVHVPHLYDLPFIWGMPYWTATTSTPTTQKILWNSADKKIADVVMSLWANFIKFANPVQNGVLVKWDAFSEETPGILIIDSKFNTSDVSNFDYKSFSFWNDYYPKVVESASSCCNTTNGAFMQVRRPVFFAGLPLILWATILINFAFSTSLLRLLKLK
jgi:carboxylesterase type B